MEILIELKKYLPKRTELNLADRTQYYWIIDIASRKVASIRTENEILSDENGWTTIDHTSQLCWPMRELNNFVDFICYEFHFAFYSIIEGNH